MALLLSYMYKLSCLFALDGCYTRENLTLDSLEQSTTTSRDVANLIGQTELVDTSYRVATTIASPIARLPAVKASHSNTPAGPFHRMVFAPLMALRKSS